MSKICWHSLRSEEVVAKINSSITNGLSHEEAKARLIEFGSNTLPKPKRRTLLSIFLYQFLSPLIYLLLAAAGIAIFVGDIKDAIVILVVVTLNAIVGAIQEGRAEQSLSALRNLSRLKIRVFRSESELIVEASEIVPGDILILSSGDAVPADSRLIEISNLNVAEAALTGESLPVAKSVPPLAEETSLVDRRNMIYAGTHITSGRAQAVVVSTGQNNEIGKIAALATNSIQPKTQLELRIAQFGRYLVLAAFILFFLVIGIGYLRGIPFAQIFMIAISQMVSMVPEGLPVAMTVALAVGVQRMAKRGTIVRRLGAVETLGSITIICSDKTGTLTRNEMTVTEAFFPVGLREIKVSGVGYAPVGEFQENKNKLTPDDEQNLQKLFEACVLCNDAQLLEPDATNQSWRILGDPTEAALLTFAAKGAMDLVKTREYYPRKAELPFDADIKMMATQHDSAEGDIIFIKGAPESVLELCGSVYHQGATQLFDPMARAETQEAAKKMADAALRLLAFGFIRGTAIDSTNGFTPFRGQVVFLGLIGQIDPPREEVANSVRDCQAAGIRPVMVTGDHKATGLAIAKHLGISCDNDLAVDGRELEQFSDQELEEKLDRISVFARVHPAQKLRIVEAFQKKGEVVAMTGDGVNDAPALMRADVGVAMGIAGTEVAKEAAKIVIADDNFSTIVAAILEGRLVYQNIKKLILFLFVTSIDEIVVLFLALILGYPLPFAAVQILWINLVTEGALTINLIMEPAEGNEMDRPPVPPNEPLLDRALLSRIPLMALASVISTFGWFIYRNSTGASVAVIQTETFTVLTFCQWFNVLNCRSSLQSVFSSDLFKSPWLLGGLLLANVLQVAVVYLPVMNEFFHTVPIDVEYAFTIFGVASLVLWSEELRKLIARKSIARKLMKH